MAQVQCTKCGHPFDEKEQSNWGPFTCSYHPRKPRSIGNTGPKGDYAELWYFPCCGKGVVGEIVNGSDKEPLRSPGCMSGFHTASRPRLFLSYARSDARFGEFLENELKRRGYSVWKDTTVSINYGCSCWSRSAKGMRHDDFCPAGPISACRGRAASDSPLSGALKGSRRLGAILSTAHE